MRESFGVGIIGAGPVTQAIHLPTLTRMPERFSVRAVMDVDADIAASVGARAGARHTTSVDELLAADDVEVVAVCSPHSFHARQVELACLAGKRAILCEKPLALDSIDAERVAAVSRSTGVPVLVGAMHTFDPGWIDAVAAWGEAEERGLVVDSSIVLPWNPRYEDRATQILRPNPTSASEADDPGHARAVREAILGLAVHNLPHVRRFLPRVDSVESALPLKPYGYLTAMRGAGGAARLLGYMNGSWKPSWTFDVWSAHRSLHIEFPPSYVQAGSATARISDGRFTREYGGYSANGYEREWLRIWELAAGESRQEEQELRSMVDDLSYAVSIADAASELVRNRADR